MEKRTSKVSSRKIKDRGSPEHQEEQNGGKRDKTLADNRAHDRAPTDHPAPAVSNGMAVLGVPRRGSCGS